MMYYKGNDPKKAILKRRLLILLFLFVNIFWILISKTFLNKTMTLLSFKTEVIFEYGDTIVHQQLNAEDSTVCRKLLNNKKLFQDDIYCGFDENICIELDGCKYCVACDGCPIIYYKNLNLYFDLSRSEMDDLKKILTKYGFSFPCI